MNIIGGTYYGNDPRGQESRQRMQELLGMAVDTGMKIAETERTKATEAFKLFDNSVKEVFDTFGSGAFEETYIDAEGNEQKNPSYEQNMKLLESASQAFKKAYGADPGSYMSQYLQKPYTQQQAQGMKFGRGDFNSAVGTAVPTPNIAETPATREQTVVQNTVLKPDQTKYVAPAEEVVVPAEVEKPATSFVTSSKEAAQEVAKEMVGISPQEYRGFTSAPAVEASAQSRLLETTKAMIRATEPIVANGDAFANKVPTETFRQFLVRYKSSWLPPGVEFTENTAMPDTEILIKNNPNAFNAYLKEQGFIPDEGEPETPQQGSPVVQNKFLKNIGVAPIPTAQPPLVNKFLKNLGVAPIYARGTGAQMMSPQELARHERRTGDVHIPALVGIKEGIVNAKAMENGGAEIVRQLNRRFPVFAAGTEATVAESLGARETSQVPAARTAQVPQAKPKGENLASQIAGKLGVSVLPAIKKSFKNTALAAKSSEVSKSKSGKKPSSGGAIPPIREAILKQEQANVRKAFSDPAYKKQMSDVLNGIEEFIDIANDEQLAYYGFDTVLTARQKRLERDLEMQRLEEDKRMGASQRDYYAAQSKSANASTDYSNAQLKLLEAQEKKTLAETELVKARMQALALGDNGLDINETKDLAFEVLDFYKGKPEEFNIALEQNAGLKTVFDTMAVLASGNPSATWGTYRKKGGLEAILSFFGIDTFSSSNPSQPTKTNVPLPVEAPQQNATPAGMELSTLGVDPTKLSSEAQTILNRISGK